jgi:hypothetical protein
LFLCTSQSIFMFLGHSMCIVISLYFPEYLYVSMPLHVYRYFSLLPRVSLCFSATPCVSLFLCTSQRIFIFLGHFTCIVMFRPLLWAQPDNISLRSQATTSTSLSHIYKKVKANWSRYRPSVAQRVGRGIALLFHDRGTRRRWVVSSTPGPQFIHFTGGWVGPRAGLDGRKI